MTYLLDLAVALGAFAALSGLGTIVLIKVGHLLLELFE